MEELTVYGLPGCVQCKATVRALDNREIEYEYIDLANHADEMDYIRSLGVTAAPYVVVAVDGVPKDHWTGFRPDKIAAFAGK